MSKGAALAALRAKVNSAYDGEVSQPATGRKNPDLRLSTTSIALDFALGVEPGGSGGIPVGQVSMFLGEKSSGKTTAALKVIGHAQRLCARCYRPATNLTLEKLFDEDGAPVLNSSEEPMHYLSGKCDCHKVGLWRPKKPEMKTKKDEEAWAATQAALNENSFEAVCVVYMDVEHALDLGWAKQNGVILEVLEHVVPGTAERSIDLADEYVRSGIVDILVLDSIAAMVPQKEIETSAEEWQQGLQARLVNKMVRKIIGSASSVRTTHRKFVTQIWINQYRDKIGGGPFGGGKTTPGGKGQRFATSVEVEFFTSDAEEEIVSDFSAMGKDDQVKHVVRRRVNFAVVKNKTAPAGIKGSFRMATADVAEIKAGDILEQEYMFKLAVALGLVEKKGPTKYVFRGKEFVSQSAVNQLLVSNPSVWAATRVQVLDILAGHKKPKEA